MATSTWMAKSSGRHFSGKRSMLIPVYDANHSPTLQPAPAARWASPDALSRWGSHNGRFARAAAADQDAFDWLVYRHWRRAPGRPGAFEPAAIDDTCVYNRTHPRRVEEVSPVDDLFLSFTLVQAWGNGALGRVHDGGRFATGVPSPAGGRPL